MFLFQYCNYCLEIKCYAAKKPNKEYYVTQLFKINGISTSDFQY